MAKRRTHVLGNKGTIECLYYLVPLGLFLPLLLPSTRQEGPVGRDSGRGGGGGGGGGLPAAEVTAVPESSLREEILPGWILVDNERKWDI